MSEHEPSQTSGLDFAKPKILYIISEDWFFYSHFVDRAIFAADSGYDVYVAMNINVNTNITAPRDIKIISVSLKRSSVDPFIFFKEYKEISSIIKFVKPDIVHNIALKPIVLGSFCGMINRVRAIINSPVGMGYVFSSNEIKALILRPIVKLLLRVALKGQNKFTIIENADDADELVASGTVERGKIHLIEGAGIDLTEYPFIERNHPRLKVMLAARMLREKGVYDFLAAVSILKGNNPDCDFVLVGDTDALNPGSIPSSELNAWNDSGLVKWEGHSNDMPMKMREADIFCLPSFREGFPKVLIEAMASGAAVVTTDVPGCRQAITHMETGLLIPKENPKALAAAIDRLLKDTSLRKSLVRRARERVENSLTKEIIGSKTLSVYDFTLKRL